MASQLHRMRRKAPRCCSGTCLISGPARPLTHPKASESSNSTLRNMLKSPHRAGSSRLNRAWADSPTHSSRTASPRTPRCSCTENSIGCVAQRHCCAESCGLASRGAVNVASALARPSAGPHTVKHHEMTAACLRRHHRAPKLGRLCPTLVSDGTCRLCQRLFLNLSPSPNSTTSLRCLCGPLLVFVLAPSHTAATTAQSHPNKNPERRRRANQTADLSGVVISQPEECSNRPGAITRCDLPSGRPLRR